MADEEPQAADAPGSAKEEESPPEEENTAHFEPVVSVTMSRCHDFLLADFCRFLRHLVLKKKTTKSKYPPARKNHHLVDTVLSTVLSTVPFST